MLGILGLNIRTSMKVDCVGHQVCGTQNHASTSTLMY